MPGPDDKPVEPAAAGTAVQSIPPESPATEANAAPVQADQAPVSTAPAVEASSAAGADTLKSEPSLLEQFDTEQKAAEAEKVAKPDEPKPELKPEEKKPDEKVDPAKEGEPAKVEAPALEPIDYFAAETGVKIPETLKLDDALKTEVAKAFDDFRADPKAGAQGLVDLHNRMMGEAQEAMTKRQWDAFNDTRKQWRTAVKADPVIGGAGYQTAMHAIADVRDTIVSRAKPGTPQFESDMKDFDDMLKVTGVGDHPAFLRMLHNGARFFKEAAVPPNDPLPPPNNGRPPRAKGQINYPNTQFPE